MDKRAKSNDPGRYLDPVTTPISFRAIRPSKHVLSYVYDSGNAPSHVEAALDLIAARDEEVELLDVATADDRDDAHREAMLTVNEAVRVGSTPVSLFDENGHPDFTTVALITEETTGRRSLHVGRDALEKLRSEN